jgi:hypothetical protein
MASSGIPAHPTANTVLQLLQKLTDSDPDYRFMSLNDLLQVLEISKPDILYHDYNTASRAIDGLLQALDDQNGEVQNLAVKWQVHSLKRRVSSSSSVLEPGLADSSYLQSRAPRHETTFPSTGTLV